MGNPVEETNEVCCYNDEEFANSHYIIYRSTSPPVSMKHPVRVTKPAVVATPQLPVSDPEFHDSDALMATLTSDSDTGQNIRESGESRNIWRM